MSAESETIFEIRDKVDWKDDDLLDDDDKENLLLLKTLCGLGPFFVSNIKQIEPAMQKYARHSQLLTLVDFGGRPIVALAEVKSPFSGFWFKKLSSAKPN